MPTGANAERPSWTDRLRSAFLKPEDRAGPSPGSRPGSVEELRAALRYADDKERAVGLLGAPLAALVSLLVIGALVSTDPAPRLRNGRANSLYVSVALYHEVLVVLLALSVVMLATAMLRKRLFLGIALALYGLAVFNLHYWGFGIPFLMGGAWLLMREYRLQRDLREAAG
ncbi:MAG: hypothetical protein ACRDYE_06000 [Acidimicrobiales bacterium]